MHVKFRIERPGLRSSPLAPAELACMTRLMSGLFLNGALVAGWRAWSLFGRRCPLRTHLERIECGIEQERISGERYHVKHKLSDPRWDEHVWRLHGCCSGLFPKRRPYGIREECLN